MGKKVRVAIVGYGGIARLHYAAYTSLSKSSFPVEVVAICEKNKESIFKNVSINLGGEVVALDDGINIYSNIDEMIENEDFDMADICLPTFLHKTMAIKLLNSGKHVLCEKPMALNSNDCAEMIDAAKSSGKNLMVGQCLRFSGVYRFLKNCIDDRRYGSLKYLELYRLCDYPKWGADFGSIERTGGCILDTHIHDVDVVRFLLGDPYAVSGHEYVDIPRCQLADTKLYYDNLTVKAIAAWDETREEPFASGYIARFDSADLICKGDRVQVLEQGKEKYFADVQSNSMIEEEIRAFIESVIGGVECTDNIPESSMKSVRLIETIKESADLRGDKIKFNS